MSIAEVTGLALMHKDNQRKAVAVRFANHIIDGEAKKFTQTTAEVPRHGKCLNPVYITMRGRAEGDKEGKLTVTAKNPTIHLDYSFRCRKCENCLLAKSLFWKERAVAEMAVAVRTWFVTLTIAPKWRLEFEYKTDHRLLKKGWGRNSGLTDYKRKSELSRLIGREVTKYLKRLRSKYKVKFRYLLVTEYHKDGFPHFHLLIHETTGAMTKREIQGDWVIGFSNCKIAEPSKASYVCKYVSKDARNRIRASVNYGAKITPRGVLQTPQRTEPGEDTDV